jgi:hypothetical protein
MSTSYSQVPHDLINNRMFQETDARGRLLLLLAWTIPDRRFGGLYSISARRLSFYSGLDDPVSDLLKIDGRLLVYEEETELLWLPLATERELSANDKQLKGLATNINQAPIGPLRSEVERFCMDRLDGDLLARFKSLVGGGIEGGSEDFKNGIKIGVSRGVSKQVKVKVKEEVKEQAKEERWTSSVRKETLDAIESWNKVLSGTRLFLNPQQAKQASTLSLNEKVADRIESIANSVRASTYLMDAPWCSFIWATRIDNARKILAGAFPPDKKSGPSRPSFN